MSSGLCSTCKSSVWCPTWTEVRCLKNAAKFSTYGLSQPTNCSDYEKRGSNFKEPKCQCKFCLQNEELYDELEEGDN